MQIAVARSFGAGVLQTFWKVTLPAIYPYLLTGARIGLGVAHRPLRPIPIRLSLPRPDDPAGDRGAALTCRRVR